MQIGREIMEQIANKAIDASKRVAPKFDRRVDAWRECVGHVVANCIIRFPRRDQAKNFDIWLKATCFGEARKYYRIERRDGLAK